MWDKPTDNPYTIKDLVREIGNIFGLDRRVTKKMIMAVFEEIKDALDNDRRVYIKDFGNFLTDKKEPKKKYVALHKKHYMTKQRKNVKFSANHKFKVRLTKNYIYKDYFDNEKYEDR